MLPGLLQIFKFQSCEKLVLTISPIVPIAAMKK